MVVVRGIQERAATELRGADPSQWKANKPAYRDYKARHYGVFDMPNFRTGQMLSQESLWGRTTITKDEVLLTYGLNEAPSRSAAPTGYLSEQDERHSDVEKGWYAHNTHNRPFYELDDVIAGKVVEEAQENLNEFIEEVN